MKKLSIIIPVYNERATIYQVLEKVSAVELPQGIDSEIIVVNDASTDGSGQEIARYVADFPGQINSVAHKENAGKGAGIRTGLQHVTGDYVIIQDADLELDPNEYGLLMMPILNGTCDVVYGSRFLKGKVSGGSSLSGAANKFLTWLSNVVFRTRLTDMETCYKLVPANWMCAMNLVEDRFGFEPEITAKLAKVPGVKFQEVPITYVARNSEEGKKIGWTDGVRAIWCILKYGWFTSRKSAFTVPVSSLSTRS